MKTRKVLLLRGSGPGSPARSTTGIRSSPRGSPPRPKRPRRTWTTSDPADRPLRVVGVDVPDSGDGVGDAVAASIARFFGLKYMAVEAYDAEIVEEEVR